MSSQQIKRECIQGQTKIGQPLHEATQNIVQSLDKSSKVMKRINIQQQNGFTLTFTSDRNKDIRTILSHIGCKNCKQSKQFQEVFDQFYDIIINLKMQKKGFVKLLKGLKQEIKKQKDQFQEQKYQYQSLVQIYEKELRNVSNLYQTCKSQLKIIKQSKTFKNQIDSYVLSPKQFSSPIKCFQKSLDKKISQTQIKKNIQNSHDRLKSQKTNKIQQKQVQTSCFDIGQSGQYCQGSKSLRQSQINQKLSSRASKFQNEQKQKQRQSKWNNSINLISQSRKSKDLKINGLSTSRKMI